ncbi:MAG: SPFH domain-containing protein [Deltaproteobacteria bacterium]|nr:SPFH domain-containing protein [Deltaproteobacteria bacterium]
MTTQTATTITERDHKSLSGIGMLLVLLALLPAATVTLFALDGQRDPPFIVIYWLLVAFDIFMLTGLFSVSPNEARILQLFGDYVGTVKRPGLQWANPLYKKTRISQRVVSFESTKLKVNDKDGNPIEIAAIIVYRVTETALASFAVNDYTAFVRVQSEAALRSMATHYAYDGHDSEVSLRGNTDEVAQKLCAELAAKVAIAGVTISEARISHLAYAPEIAHAMLQRQQAAAVIAARQKIVEGAVGMVESALKALTQHGIVTLDEERKAQMVSNLLVVLCGDRGAQPIVNAGTFYS